MIDFNILSFCLAQQVSVFNVTILFFPHASSEARYFINFEWFLDLNGLFLMFSMEFLCVFTVSENALKFLIHLLFIYSFILKSS